MSDFPRPVWDFASFSNFVPTSGLLYEYVNYGIACTDAHPLFHIGSMSAVISTAISPYLDLEHFGEIHPLHYYVLLIAPSSRGRKSSSIKRATNIAGPVLNAMSQRGSRIWWPQLASPEGIADELSREPNRLMCLSEWAAMHGGQKKKGYANAPLLLNEMYDATEQCEITRSKGNTVKIKRPRLSVLGAATASLIDHETDMGDWLHGKLSRYLIVAPTDQSKEEMLSSCDSIPIRQRLEYLLQFIAQPPPFTRMQLSRDAWQYFIQWKKCKAWADLQERAPEHIRPSFSRADAHIFRLAAIYQISQTFHSTHEVSAANMYAAISFVATCYELLCISLGTLESMNRDRVQRVCNVLGPAKNGMSRKLLLKRAKMQTRELNDVLNTLFERGELVSEQRGSETYYRFVPLAE